MTEFFKNVVRELSEGQSKKKRLTPEAIENAAAELLSIAFAHLKEDYMLPKDFLHFSEWFTQSLSFVSTDDMAFVKSMLKDKTLPKDVEGLLKSIAKNRRDIAPDQLKFVQEIINGAKRARNKSRRLDMKAMIGLQEDMRKKLNAQIANTLPEGEVAELFRSMGGADGDDMKEMNEELQKMLGDDPISALGELSPQEAKALKKNEGQSDVKDDGDDALATTRRRRAVKERHGKRGKILRDCGEDPRCHFEGIE